VQDDGQWFILADMARRLGRSDSTVRNWRKVYRDVIPARRNSRGQVTYPLAVFERIRAMAEERLTPREIAADLTREQPGPAPPRATLEDVRELLTEIRDLLRQLVERAPSPS
jgi:transposase-like protein